MEHDLTILTNLVRVGVVTDRDANRRRCRVKYPDAGITSGWLRVLVTQASGWLPQINDMVLVLYLPADNGDGFVLGGIV